MSSSPGSDEPDLAVVGNGRDHFDAALLGIEPDYGSFASGANRLAL